MIIKLVKQPKGSNLCGHCCIAMIHGISLYRAITMIGHENIMMPDEILKFTTCIDSIYSDLHLNFHKDPNSNRAHWTLTHEGVSLDPAEIPIKKIWPIKESWIIQ